MRWTIGMANFDDFKGVYMTIQALRRMHREILKDAEIILVDNSPNYPSSENVRSLMANVNNGRELGGGARYIAAGEIVGTSAPRNRIFEEARGDIVVVCDPHVIFPNLGQFTKLGKWFDDHPDSQDLISGPMWADDFIGMATHFTDIWDGEMWGKWGQAWEACEGGDRFAVIPDEDNSCKYITVERNHIILTSSSKCGLTYPKIPYAGHEDQLRARGYRQLGISDDDELEIPGMGLGTFVCRREAWLGFHPQARGFGGEEMYIHEKYRQHGRRCICLGLFPWLHRFGHEDRICPKCRTRFSGPTYPLTVWNKVRNYILELQELGISYDDCKQEFLGRGRINQEEWDSVVKDPLAYKPIIKKAEVPKRTIEEIYAEVQVRPRDLNKHMPKLLELAKTCQSAAEISHRQESFIALAAGSPELLISHNTEMNSAVFVEAKDAANVLEMDVDNLTTDKIETIPAVDLLFIDSTHTKACLSRELEAHGNNVGRFIALHDTVSHADRGEDGGPGLAEAVKEYIETHPEWFVASHTDEQYGFTVLGRLEEDKPEDMIRIWDPGYGPGTELLALMESIGVKAHPGCGCKPTAAWMNKQGHGRCQKNIFTIVDIIKKNYDKWGWKKVVDEVTGEEKMVEGKLVEVPGKLTLANNLRKEGLVWKVVLLNPVASLVQEAIRRAKEKEEKGLLGKEVVE